MPIVTSIGISNGTKLGICLYIWSGIKKRGHIWCSTHALISPSPSCFCKSPLQQYEIHLEVTHPFGNVGQHRDAGE